MNVELSYFQCSNKHCVFIPEQKQLYTKNEEIYLLVINNHEMLTITADSCAETMKLIKIVLNKYMNFQDTMELLIEHINCINNYKNYLTVTLQNQKLTFKIETTDILDEYIIYSLNPEHYQLMQNNYTMV